VLTHIDAGHDNGWNERARVEEEEAEAAFSSRRGRGPKLVVLKLEEEVEQIQRVCRKTQEKKIWRSADIDP